MLLVGCGGNNGNQNNSTTEAPKEEPLVFSECLDVSATTYDGTESNGIDKIKEFKRYKTVTFTAKKDFSFSQFIYSYKGQLETGESFDIEARGRRNIETPKANNSSRGFSISSTEETETWTVRQSVDSSELLILLSYSPIYTKEAKMEVKKGEAIKLNFGEIKELDLNMMVWKNVYISLYDFILK